MIIVIFLTLVLYFSKFLFRCIEPSCILVFKSLASKLLVFKFKLLEFIFRHIVCSRCSRLALLLSTSSILKLRFALL